MRRLLAVVFCFSIFSIAASSACAGGDKVRGDKGQGAVVQSH